MMAISTPKSSCKDNAHSDVSDGWWGCEGLESVNQKDVHVSTESEDNESFGIICPYLKISSCLQNEGNRAIYLQEA
jgi:hypothetical protein